MRKLTLHEKITIKGVLQYWNITGQIIAKMTDAKTAIHYWRMCVGVTSISRCFKINHEKGRIK